MGLRVRKSINLGGGFKINISKSGVGYSWGTKGYRVTKTANGSTRQTISIPGTGISYVEEQKQQKQFLPQSSPKNQRKEPPVQNDKKKTLPPQESALSDGETQSDPIKKKIEKCILLNKIGIGFLFGGLLIFVHWGFLIVPIIGLILIILAHTVARAKLCYDFDTDEEIAYERKLAAWQVLFESKKTSQVLSKFTDSGVSIKRHPCSFDDNPPFYLKTNVEYLKLKLHKGVLLFLLPDRAIFENGGKIKAINYSDMNITVAPSRFMETDRLPKDAQVLEYVWQHANKNGEPDKRFKENRKLPICLYANVLLEAPNDFRIRLQVSNAKKAQTFAQMLES